MVFTCKELIQKKYIKTIVQNLFPCIYTNFEKDITLRNLYGDINFLSSVWKFIIQTTIRISIYNILKTGKSASLRGYLEECRILISIFRKYIFTFDLRPPLDSFYNYSKKYNFVYLDES